MQQLAGSDSYWLYTERGTVYNHVGTLGIYDPSTAPGGAVKFKSILRYFERRLDRTRVFRRRLARMPQDVDRPYWLDDPVFDLEFHIRHIALPEPGDWRQLMIQVARIHSRPLDRSRPLWEAYVIEGLHRIPGLPQGSFAIVMKVHHAAVDGQAGVQLLRAVHSLTPALELADERQPTHFVERDPTALEVYSRALVNSLRRTVDASVLSARTLGKVGALLFGEASHRVGSPTAEPGGAAIGLPQFLSAPRTRFNQPVSANRVVEAIALPMAPMQALRARFDGITVNDIFLTLVSGALRKYLESKHELPARSMTALMPISVRRADQVTAPGNQVGGAPVRLHTDVADPLRRLWAVHADALAAKRSSGHDFLKEIMDHLPHSVAESFVRYAVIPQVNVTVSNLRGPDVPLFVAGARLVHFYPLNIATDYVGLSHTAFSYDGVLWIAAVACRNMLPDPAFYADCMRASFEELIASAQSAPVRAVGDTAVSGEDSGAVAGPRKAPAKRRAERRLYGSN